MADEAGPHVMIAAICEGIETRRGFTVRSAFTGLTQRHAFPNDPTRMAPLVHEMTLAVVLTSGSARGHGQVVLRLEGPAGIRTRLATMTVNFDHPAAPAPCIFNLTATFEDPGLYYFDLLYEGALLTRVPMQITFAPPARVG